MARVIKYKDCYVFHFSKAYTETGTEYIPTSIEQVKLQMTYVFFERFFSKYYVNFTLFNHQIDTYFP